MTGSRSPASPSMSSPGAVGRWSPRLTIPRVPVLVAPSPDRRFTQLRDPRGAGSIAVAPDQSVADQGVPIGRGRLAVRQGLAELTDQLLGNVIELQHRCAFRFGHDAGDERAELAQVVRPLALGEEVLQL